MYYNKNKIIIFISGKDVRNRWKNLRDKYRVELQKKPKPKSGDGTQEYDEDDTDNTQQTETEVLSSWQYFDSLGFLKDQFTPRENKGNLAVCSGILSPSSVVDHATLDPNEELFEDPNPTSPSPIPSPSISTNTISKARSKKRYTDIGSKLVELEEKKLKLLANDNNDDDLKFFESLLPHARKLPDDKKMLMMMEIQQVVYRHVYSMPPSSLPSPSEEWSQPSSYSAHPLSTVCFTNSVPTTSNTYTQI